MEIRSRTLYFLSNLVVHPPPHLLAEFKPLPQSAFFIFHRGASLQSLSSPWRATVDYWRLHPSIRFSRIWTLYTPWLVPWLASSNCSMTVVMLVFNRSGNSLIISPSITLLVSGASSIGNFLLGDDPIGLFSPRAVFPSLFEILRTWNLLACLFRIPSVKL